MQYHLGTGAIQQDGESIALSSIGDHRRIAVTWVFLLVLHITLVAIAGYECHSRASTIEHHSPSSSYLGPEFIATREEKSRMV